MAGGYTARQTLIGKRSDPLICNHAPYCGRRGGSRASDCIRLGHGRFSVLSRPLIRDPSVMPGYSRCERLLHTISGCAASSTVVPPTYAPPRPWPPLSVSASILTPISLGSNVVEGFSISDQCSGLTIGSVEVVIGLSIAPSVRTLLKINGQTGLHPVETGRAANSEIEGI